MKKRVTKKSDTVLSPANPSTPKSEASVDLEGSQNPRAEPKSIPALVTKNEPESPSNSPPNRAAFLLGFYVQLPAPDLVFEPLVALCDGLPVTKVMLLDNCLARISASHTEEHFHSYASRDSASSRATEESASFLYFDEIDKLRTIAGNFWSGRSELCHWYGAGNSVGSLMALLVRGKTIEQSEQEFIEEFGRQLDATGMTIRQAAKCSYESAVSSRICDGFHRIREELPANEKDFKLKLWMCKYVQQLAAHISNVPSRIPALTNRLKEEQAEFVYEQMTIHEMYGTELLALVQ